MRLKVAILTLMLIAGLAWGQHCRTIAYPAATYHAPVYHTPVYKTYSYDYTYKDVVVVPQKDYYFSVSDGYRDALIADAVAYRVLSALGKAPSSAPLARYKEPDDGAGGSWDERTPAPSRTPVTRPPAAVVPSGKVSPELQKYADATCVTCHNRPGRMNLSDLGKLSVHDRKEIWWQLTTQRMPKPPHKKPTDEVMRLWAEYVEPNIARSEE